MAGTKHIKIKMEKEKPKLTNYERTRILGARALQIAMDAPLLIEISKEKLEEINYDPMEISRMELESNVLPITVKKPMPKKKSVKIKRVVEKEVKDTKILEKEAKEEEEVMEEGEIMELAIPEDEFIEEESGEGRELSEELQ